MRNLIKRLKQHFNKVYSIGEYNVFDIHSEYGKNFKIRVYGNNNHITIKEGCSLSNTTIYISGDNNVVLIDQKTRFMGPCKINMSNGANLYIGENTGIRGVSFILDNANVSIGKLCMFSYNITIRNTDSHKVLNLTTNEIVNQPKDITIGNHVWIGQNATILKGVSIGDNSIVALGAVVTKSCPPNSIVAGNPAKIVKTGITWDY